MFTCLCAEFISCLPNISYVRAEPFLSRLCRHRGHGTQRANGGKAKDTPTKAASFMATAVRGVSPSSF